MGQLRRAGHSAAAAAVSPDAWPPGTLGHHFQNFSPLSPIEGDRESDCVTEMCVAGLPVSTRNSTL